MTFTPGDVVVVDKFARNQKGIIVFCAESMAPIKISRYEKLIYAGLHDSGDHLFLHRGMLIRASFEIFKYIISLTQFNYQRRVLEVLNRT